MNHPRIPVGGIGSVAVGVPAPAVVGTTTGAEPVFVKKSLTGIRYLISKMIAAIKIPTKIGPLMV
ncbi:MAG: hypothetical protein NUV90_01735 [Candidatus Parcubacteria bacterium]|nr:hypothetical protein [Candidatus Parcubacteria bacterium]